MWKSRLFYLLGSWVLMLASLELVPLIYAVVNGEEEAASSFFASTILSLLLGGALFLGFRSTEPVRVTRLTIFLPITGTIALAIVAGLPLFFLFPDRSIIAALYDGMSQITTNGSSAFEGAIDEMPSVILWRAITSWVGGLMAISYALSLLMAMNSGGMQLHRSPLNFGDSESGYMRLKAITRTILPIYAGVTLTCLTLLIITGTTPFNSLVLAMSVVSTSGIVPENIVQSQGMLTHLILSVFLLIGLSNWDFHQLRLKNRSLAFKQDRELRTSLFITLMTTLFLFIVLGYNGADIITILFAVTSALSTFGVMPSETLSNAEMILPIGLVLMMLAAIGGAIAGTSGGIKQMRLMVIYKMGRAEVDRLAHPHGVHTVHYGKTVAERRDLDAVWLLLGSFVLVISAGAIAFAILGIDFQSALTLSFTAVTLSGPLVASADPAFAGYGSLAQVDYFLLSILMLIGRVETSFFMAILAKSLWKG